MHRKLVGVALAAALGGMVAGGCTHHKQHRRSSRPHPTSHPAPTTTAQRADPPLVTAARSGDADRVRQLLDTGADINARGAQDMTALMAAGAAGRDDVASKVTQLVDRTRSLEREIQGLRQKLASGGSRDLLGEAQLVSGVKVLAAKVDGADAKSLRETADQLKDRLGTGIVVLGAVESDKVHLVATISKDLTPRLKAGDLIKPVAELVGGRGGGRPDFAQAGGSRPDKVDDALALVPGIVAKLAAAVP